jgi:hypothetical protein
VAENQQRDSRSANPVGNKNNQPTSPTHLTVDPPFPSTNQPKAEDKNNQPPKGWMRFLQSDWVIVYVTVANCIIALFMWLTIKRQANIMDAQARDTKESDAQTFAVLKEQTDNLLISAKAATVSAMAADESAKASLQQIQLMKSKERARLEIKAGSVQVENLGEKIWDLKTKLEFRNLGPSRAYITRSSGALTVIRENVQQSTDEDVIDSPLSLPDSFLDGMSSTIDVPFWYWPLPQGDNPPDMKAFAAEFKKGTVAIHLRGFVEYETIGINWHRDFWYILEFNSIGRMLLGNPEPETDVERITQGWWAVEQEEEYEMNLS